MGQLRRILVVRNGAERRHHLRVYALVAPHARAPLPHPGQLRYGGPLSVQPVRQRAIGRQEHWAEHQHLGARHVAARQEREQRRQPGLAGRQGHPLPAVVQRPVWRQRERRVAAGRDERPVREGRDKGHEQRQRGVWVDIS